MAGPISIGSSDDDVIFIAKVPANRLRLNKRTAHDICVEYVKIHPATSHSEARKQYAQFLSHIEEAAFVQASESINSASTSTFEENPQKTSELDIVKQIDDDTNVNPCNESGVEPTAPIIPTIDNSNPNRYTDKQVNETLAKPDLDTNLESIEPDIYVVIYEEQTETINTAVNNSSPKSCSDKQGNETLVKPDNHIKDLESMEPIIHVIHNDQASAEAIIPHVNISNPKNDSNDQLTAETNGKDEKSSEEPIKQSAPTFDNNSSPGSDSDQQASKDEEPSEEPVKQSASDQKASVESCEDKEPSEETYKQRSPDSNNNSSDSEQHSTMESMAINNDEEPSDKPNEQSIPANIFSSAEDSDKPSSVLPVKTQTVQIGTASTLESATQHIAENVVTSPARSEAENNNKYLDVINLLGTVADAAPVSTTIFDATVENSQSMHTDVPNIHTDTIRSKSISPSLATEATESATDKNELKIMDDSEPITAPVEAINKLCTSQTERMGRESVADILQQALIDSNVIAPDGIEINAEDHLVNELRTSEAATAFKFDFLKYCSIRETLNKLVNFSKYYRDNQSRENHSKNIVDNLENCKYVFGKSVKDFANKISTNYMNLSLDNQKVFCLNVISDIADMCVKENICFKPIDSAWLSKKIVEEAVLQPIDNNAQLPKGNTQLGIQSPGQILVQNYELLQQELELMKLQFLQQPFSQQSLQLLHQFIQTVRHHLPQLRSELLQQQSAQQSHQRKLFIRPRNIADMMGTGVPTSASDQPPVDVISQMQNQIRNIPMHEQGGYAGLLQPPFVRHAAIHPIRTPPSLYSERPLPNQQLNIAPVMSTNPDMHNPAPGSNGSIYGSGIATTGNLQQRLSPAQQRSSPMQRVSPMENHQVFQQQMQLSQQLQQKMQNQQIPNNTGNQINLVSLMPMLRPDQLQNSPTNKPKLQSSNVSNDQQIGNVRLVSGQNYNPQLPPSNLILRQQLQPEHIPHTVLQRFPNYAPDMRHYGMSFSHPDYPVSTKRQNSTMLSLEIGLPPNKIARSDSIDQLNAARNTQMASYQSVAPQPPYTPYTRSQARAGQQLENAAPGKIMQRRHTIYHGTPIYQVAPPDLPQNQHQFENAGHNTMQRRQSLYQGQPVYPVTPLNPPQHHQQLENAVHNQMQRRKSMYQVQMNPVYPVAPPNDQQLENAVYNQMQIPVAPMNPQNQQMGQSSANQLQTGQQLENAASRKIMHRRHSIYQEQMTPVYPVSPVAQPMDPQQIQPPVPTQADAEPKRKYQRRMTIYEPCPSLLLESAVPKKTRQRSKSTYQKKGIPVDPVALHENTPQSSLPDPSQLLENAEPKKRQRRKSTYQKKDKNSQSQQPAGPIAIPTELQTDSQNVEPKKKWQRRSTIRPEKTDPLPMNPPQIVPPFTIIRTAFGANISQRRSSTNFMMPPSHTGAQPPIRPTSKVYEDVLES